MRWHPSSCFLSDVKSEIEFFQGERNTTRVVTNAAHATSFSAQPPHTFMVVSFTVELVMLLLYAPHLLQSLAIRASSSQKMNLRPAQNAVAVSLRQKKLSRKERCTTNVALYAVNARDHRMINFR